MPESHDIPRRDACEIEMIELAAWLRAALAEWGRAELVVDAPEFRADRLPGERDATGRRYRNLRMWLDLADGVHAHLQLRPPEARDEHEPWILAFTKRTGELEVHDPNLPAAERYAEGGPFARLYKPDHPGFLLPLLDALGFAAPTSIERVLILGCHDGDELDVLAQHKPQIPASAVTGVDRDHAAVERALSRFPEATFLQADLGEVDQLRRVEGRFDLLLAINVLQSPSLNGPAVLAHFVREHLQPSAGVIVGVPASRFVEGDVTWGARTRNFRETDLSLAVRDLAGHRRYLHQQGFRTRITGRYDLLVTARRSSGTASADSSR